MVYDEIQEVDPLVYEPAKPPIWKVYTREHRIQQE